VYCYAVRNRSLAQRRYKKHNPEGEFLFEPSTMARGSIPRANHRAGNQRQLF
jgi:hypothetical protein